MDSIYIRKHCVLTIGPIGGKWLHLPSRSFDLRIIILPRDRDPFFRIAIHFWVGDIISLGIIWHNIKFSLSFNEAFYSNVNAPTPQYYLYSQMKPNAWHRRKLNVWSICMMRSCIRIILCTRIVCMSARSNAITIVSRPC